LKERLPEDYVWRVQEAKRKNKKGRAMEGMLMGIRKELYRDSREKRVERKRRGRGNWMYTGGRRVSVIDYVLTDEETREEIEYLKVGDKMDSDHHPVVVTWKRWREKGKGTGKEGGGASRRVWAEESRVVFRERDWRGMEGGEGDGVVTAQLEERKLKLNHYWLEYCNVQSQLEMLVEDESNDRATFEDAYFGLSAKIRELLVVRSPSNRSIVSPSPSNVLETRESTLHVRLPKISLTTFSGKWFPFFDAFNSIIHSNTSIGNIQKLQYLRTSLSGEAADVISSLEISDLNYEVAWKLLKDRYDNKRVIVHTHIKAIMELPSLTKENSIELRQVADSASKHIRALQALKRPTSQWDDLLVYILSAKLDAITLREWQSSLSGTDLPNLKQLLDFMNHRCQVLEATSKSTNTSNKQNNARASSQGKRQTACATMLNCKECKEDNAKNF
ncbi:hypothetical protein ALC57_15647, partial [Trachymyrmex cornetzi]